MGFGSRVNGYEEMCNHQHPSLSPTAKKALHNSLAMERHPALKIYYKEKIGISGFTTKHMKNRWRVAKIKAYLWFREQFPQASKYIKL